MSAPVSATMTCAVVAEIPGMEVSKATWGSNGTSRAQISALRVAIEASKKSRWSIHLSARDGVVSPEVALERLFEPVGLLAHDPFGHVGQDHRVPLAGDHPCAATSASHSASERSVSRPGTFLTWGAALQSHNSSKRHLAQSSHACPLPARQLQPLHRLRFILQLCSFPAGHCGWSRWGPLSCMQRH